MPPRPTINVSSLVDLPAVIQSVGGSRRSGVLEVRSNGLERRLWFQNGQLVALGGGPRDLLTRALSWTRAIPPTVVAEAVKAAGPDPDPEVVATALRARGELMPETLLDAVELCIQEEFATVIAWPTPTYDFVTDSQPDPWVEFQLATGLATSPASLLLEALRRQDEQATFGDLVPDPWDVLRLDLAAPPPPEAADDERLVLEKAGEAALARDLLNHPLLTPFRAIKAVVTLRRSGVLRVVAAAELAALAEQAREHGKTFEAYRMLLRAVDLGHDSARVRELIANLAEAEGDRAAAAAQCMAAVPLLQTPQAMVAALKHALRLGIEPEGPLTQLVALSLQMGDDRGTIEALLALARLYENRGDRTRAMEAIGEAQSLGADRVITARMLARLAAAGGDANQTALQLELAARAATELKRPDEAIQAWQALLALRPDRIEPARVCAELLVTAGRGPDAAELLRQVLAAAPNAADDVQFPAWDLLAKLDPNDTAAHDWLAKSYAKRRDREGATRQLRLVADAQEKSGDDSTLVETLERIVVLGGEDVELLRRLGAAHARLDRQGAAVDAWSRSCDLAMETGQLKDARQTLALAFASFPAAQPLRARSGQVALREGDRAAAQRDFRAAADLARGAGEPDRAREMLEELIRLRPDDLLVRIQFCEVLHELSDAIEAEALADVARLAARTANHGIALDFAKRRVGLPGVDRMQARSELVELMRRAGDAAGERSLVKEMLDEHLANGDFERAVELLSRQVATHPRDPDLALQLAEAHGGLGDQRMAARLYRHAVVLLQAEGRHADARNALDSLDQVSEDDVLIAAARRCLDAGEIVEWERLRQDLEHDQRQHLVTKLGSEMVKKL